MDEGIKRIVIAGAGQAGATVAFGLRRGGFGGEIALVGDEVHLPYERPQLSKEMLRPESAGHRSIRTRAEFNEQRIELVLGRRVVAVDVERHQIQLDDGRGLAFDRLVLAGGVSPRQLPGGPHDAAAVRYLRTVEDASGLCADLETGGHVAIVGGGVIGLEVAAAARARGCEVTVIEAADRLMSRSVDDTVSRFLDRAHRGKGVDIRYRVLVTELRDGRYLELSDGSTVAADTVLVGIGVTPNIAGFDALGITDAAGVRVDAYGQTALQGIFATGDIASQKNENGFGRIETWANAQDHALNVARNLLGERVAYESPVWFWSDQGTTNLQVVGNATRGRRIVRGDERGEAFSVFWLGEGDRVTGCASVNMPKDMALARRWVKQGNRVDPHQLAEPGTPLRNCAL
ncbi:ferredoxin reductase [Paraburkholderia xenovorans LB400]|uniref:p-cumate dioxygenase ferredoxin reductase subunit (CmtAa) n=1 Tax=Paraburkholderia xenovorans (strain LB400) TaxID=266265 RepID=Q143Q8_PARXL|nr:FAD-dependent oxidoreductase [Paraburkholderia xenovorans]ABE29431.1 p-cumate dioxygenase ferredoxin reductase subunit (CmtAa) [Paraburkholderia xenovorans LB400]AIP29718.1 ferredoxin reductase [Paraburkholderia xenovorans LB400]